MKVFLTGATGFIGRPTWRELQAKGHEVCILTRTPSNLFTQQGVTQIEGSLDDIPQWLPQLMAFKPDSCIHYAWQGIPDYSLKNSLFNLEMSANLLDVLGSIGCSYVAVSGSCWEYGAVTEETTEQAEVIRPSVFGAAKNALREIAVAVCADHEMKLGWGRVFFPYGPHQKRASIVPFVCQALTQGEVPRARTPNIRNDFIYVDDVALAFIHMVEEKLEGVFNIGSGEGTYVGEIVNRLCRVDGKAEPHQDPFSGSGFWANNNRLVESGWQPKTPLNEGLKRTLQEYRDPTS